MKTILLLVLWLAPNISLGYDYIVQSGAYTGMIGSGIGDSYKQHEYSGIMSYTPTIITDDNPLMTASFKYKYILSNKYVKPYVHSGILLNLLDNDTFVTLPDQYPDKYYPPTGYYFTVGTGFEIEDTGWYFEVTTLDYFLEAKARNWNYLKFIDIFDWGIGYKWGI